MKFLNIFKTAFVSTIAVGACAGLMAASTHQTQPQPIKVRWLIAHEPLDAFRRAAKTFSEELKKESHGQLELVVLMPKDVGSSTGNVEPKEIFELLKSGKVELSQTVTSGVGQFEPNFYALDLPFLFRDHAHAAKVLDGKIGEHLLASLEKSHVRGLAFTYSGGFRVIPSSEKALRSVNDFKGMRVRTTSSPVAQATLRELGAVPVPLSLEEGHNALKFGEVDAAETTYIRVNSVFGDHSKYLNETFHSLFLTSILASDSFYQSLSQENRDALKRAALKAARIERQDSVEDGVRVKAEFEKSGIEVVHMSAANEKAFRAKVKPVYKEFAPTFEKNLVDDIVATK